MPPRSQAARGLDSRRGGIPFCKGESVKKYLDYIILTLCFLISEGLAFWLMWLKRII